MTFVHLSWRTLACPYCEAALGVGARSPTDYVLAAALVVGLTIGYAIKYLIRPGEDRADHIKPRVLNDAFVNEPEDPA